MAYDPDLELLLHLTGTTGEQIEDLLVDGRPPTPAETARLHALPMERLVELTPVVHCLRVLMTEMIAERDRCEAELDEIERRWCNEDVPTLDRALAAARIPAAVVERVAVLISRLQHDPINVLDGAP
jgi:hypothetical protein